MARCVVPMIGMVVFILCALLWVYLALAAALAMLFKIWK
jgi:hypothetical protein